MKELREKLSDLEHDRWANWQRYMFSRCKPGALGTLVIEKEDVEHWTRQINTKYADLSEREKDSDRKEADKTLELIGPYLKDKT